jgi:hypothetical protein
VKPHTDAAIRYSLPNLAIFLWRLAAYRVRVSPPGTRRGVLVAAVANEEGGHPAAVLQPRVVGVEVHPVDALDLEEHMIAGDFGHSAR